MKKFLLSIVLIVVILIAGSLYFKNISPTLFSKSQADVISIVSSIASSAPRVASLLPLLKAKVIATTSITTSVTTSVTTSKPLVAAVATAPILPTLAVLPSTSVLQGDPLMVVVNGAGTTSTSTVQKITFDDQSLDVMTYKSKPTAFIGIDISKKPGVYVLKMTLANGKIVQKNITVIARKETVAPLGIPASLGGNTPAAETNLVHSLAANNAILATLKSAAGAYWSADFQFPVANPVVTDPYGYLRQTGAYEITHKGTDFQAPPGTPVMTINRGVVILVKDFYSYGNTIIVDHGTGILSFYMHLSKVNVTQGQTVARGQVIGESGETGYAEGPHLHLTIRVNGVSIDPMKFMNFFK